MSPTKHVVLIHEESAVNKTNPPADRVLHICPHELLVSTGDDVRWLYNELDRFECTFQRDSPFGKQHMTVVGINGSSPDLTVTVLTGSFSYTVNDGFMVKDPIIIVDPSPKPK